MGAWNVEHNNLHHYRLGESGDPDLVERNLELMRDIQLPRPLKYVGVAFLAAMWKWYYYAPNTYKQLKIAQMRKDGITVSEEDAHAPFTLPAPLLLIKALLGTSLPLYATAVANLALADAVSNIHSFIIIATNHCGDDMYKFDRSVTPRSGSFYMRAITSSSNFRTSNGIDPKTGLARRVHGNMADLNDFMHGWLNYQIEHHAFPQLSMPSYQKSAPQMRALCAKHNVPYVQHSVFRRLKKTADVMVGHKSMRPFDRSWEYEKDLFTWDDQKMAKAAKEIDSHGSGAF